MPSCGTLSCSAAPGGRQGSVFTPLLQRYSCPGIPCLALWLPDFLPFQPRPALGWLRKTKKGGVIDDSRRSCRAPSHLRVLFASSELSRRLGGAVRVLALAGQRGQVPTVQRTGTLLDSVAWKGRKLLTSERSAAGLMASWLPHIPRQKSGRASGHFQWPSDSACLPHSLCPLCPPRHIRPLTPRTWTTLPSPAQVIPFP